MCGIAGILARGGELSLEAEPRLRSAADSLRHRGPDDEGYYQDREVGFAFRRLSILDLEGGHQPMANEDGSVQVIFNGEIYNFRELSDWLVARGHRLRTRSDTEVIAHLYEEKGAEFVGDLRGMFAIALWDSRTRSLLLVRDRLGIKPLFYWFDDRELLFASEIKGILAMLPRGARRMDEEGLRRYLTFFYVPGEATLFQGIRKLLPGHLLEIRSGQLRIRRYWRLPQPSTSTIPSREEAVRRLRELLEASVRMRLISDVPLGAFLSGGIDSSVVVSLMRRVSNDPVRTFSIGFEEPEFNELPVARRVAEALGTDHQELVVHPEAVELVDTVISAFDEPFGDPSAVPTYLVSRLARTQVTVALSGDGGDELFAGYRRYRGLEQLDGLRRTPAPLRAMGHRLLEQAGIEKRWAERVRGALRRSLKQFPADYLDAMNALGDPRVASAIHPDRLRPDPAPIWPVEFGAWRDPVDGAQRIDIHHYLPEDILAKVDRMSMACSLEARVPLLDHRVVEFVFSLPAEWRRSDGRPKSLLLDSAGADLPREAWDRPKQGFGIPFSHWFREDLREYLRDILLGDAAKGRGLWNPRGMEALLRAHEQRVWDLSEHLWAFLSLELWLRRYLDGGEASGSRVTPGAADGERRLGMGGGRGI